MKYLIILAFAFFLFLPSAHPTHIPGGNLTYQCTGNPNEYIFTLTLFVSCPSNLSTSYNITAANNCGLTNPTIQLPQVGLEQEVSQICVPQIGQSECANPPGTIPGVMMHTYQSTIILPAGCNSWVFNFESCCRDISTNTNLSSSGNYMYFETVMNSMTAPCDASPYVTAQPIPYVCAGQPQSYCPGAIDPDGDSLYFSLINPYGQNASLITHPSPYSPTAPLQGLILDPFTGCLSFNQPTTGNFVVTYLIEAFDANGNLTGSVVHDFQFEVIACSNITPMPPAAGINLISGNATQIGPAIIELCEGGTTCFNMTFTDANPTDILTIDATFSNIFTAFPGAIVTTSGTNPFTVNVCWTVPNNPPTKIIATTMVSDGSCPIEGKATQVVLVNITPSTKALSDTTICGAQAAQLSATSGSIFNWATISGDAINVPFNFSCNPCANPTAKPTVTTRYEVTSNLLGGCVNKDTVTVTVVDDFTPTAILDTLLCGFTTRNLNVTSTPPGPGYSYAWTPISTLTNPNIANPIASPIQTTTYTAMVTSPEGCVKFDSTKVTVNLPPSVTLIPGNTTTCPGEVVQFDVNFSPFNANFDPMDPSLWSSIKGESLTKFSGCGAINATGNALWFTGTGVREIVTNSLAVSSCSSLDFCLWIGNSLSNSQGTGCENADPGEDITLNYSIDGGVTWLPIQTYLQSDWDAGGTYPNTWACFSVPIPAPALTPNTMFKWDQPIHGSFIDNWAIDNISLSCGGGSNYTYSWSPATDLSDPVIRNPIYTPTNTETYTVRITDNDDCFTDFSQTITVADYNVTLSANDSTICLGDPVLFNATTSLPGSYDYTWTYATVMNDSTIANPIGNFTSSGTKNVTVTTSYAGRCFRNDNVSITVTEPLMPQVLLTHPTCKNVANGKIIITPTFNTGSGLQHFEWKDSITVNVLQNTNSLIMGMQDSLVNILAGSYTITMTDSSGCSIDTTVTLISPDSVTINMLTPNNTICIDGSTSINATAIGGNGAPYTYNWFDLSTLTPILGNGPHTVSPIVSPTCYAVFVLDPIGCTSDTQLVCMTLYPNLTANTSEDSISICPNLSTRIDMNVIGGSGVGYKYDWYENNVLIGNGALINVTPTFSPTTYIGVATDNCTTPSDSVTVYVDWFDLPTIDFAKNKPDSCYPVTVEFSNTSTPTNLIGTSSWNISDGAVLNGNTVNHTFLTPVCHDVTLTLTTVDGCILDTTKYDLVCPFDHPSAKFIMTPPVTSLLNPNVLFENLSYPAPLSYQWEFNSGIDPDTSTEMNPSKTYSANNPGNYNVELIVTDLNGCQDTVVGTLIVNGIYLFYAPNTFTPDGDGINDTWKIYGESIDMTQYTLKIFDRWGGLIYSSVNAGLGWDGTQYGKPVPQGTYVWKVVAKEKYSTIIHDNYGHVNVIR